MSTITVFLWTFGRRSGNVENSSTRRNRQTLAESHAAAGRAAGAFGGDQARKDDEVSTVVATAWLPRRDCRSVTDVGTVSGQAGVGSSHHKATAKTAAARAGWTLPLPPRVNGAENG